MSSVANHLNRRPIFANTLTRKEHLNPCQVQIPVRHAVGMVIDVLGSQAASSLFPSLSEISHLSHSTSAVGPCELASHYHTTTYHRSSTNICERLGLKVLRKTGTDRVAGTVPSPTRYTSENWNCLLLETLLTTSSVLSYSNGAAPSHPPRIRPTRTDWPNDRAWYPMSATPARME